MKRLLVFLLFFVMIGATPIWADTTNSGATTNTQTNTSGSNTTISGGYSQESTTTYQSGSSSTTSTTNTTNAYSGDSRVVNSSAPSMSAMSQDLCVVGVSVGAQKFGIGFSGGTYRTDENCERIKLSKVLNDLGMKVAAVSILCQDERVFHAMIQSGTPCPYNGKIGTEALKEWEKYGELRPDYERYTADLKYIEKKNKQLQKEYEKAVEENAEILTQQQEEINSIQAEKEKLLKEIESKKKTQK